MASLRALPEPELETRGHPCIGKDKFPSPGMSLFAKLPIHAENPGMQLLPVTGGKAATAYSIVNNAMNVAEAAMAGATQYSADGVTAFNFSNYLEGKSYEIRLTMSLADVTAGAVRTTFYIADSSAPQAGVGGANLGFQIVTNATSLGTESIFRRLAATSSPTAAAINGSHRIRVRLWQSNRLPPVDQRQRRLHRGSLRVAV